MPNWCSNHITVRGTDPREIQRLADAFGRGEFCDAVIPVPQILKNPETTTNYGDPDKQARADQIRAEALEATGYQSWYDFCTNRWGTKWDIGEEANLEMDQDRLGFSAPFESAWAPPMGIVEALVDQGYEVTLYYYEPGMGFCGKFEDGYDSCYEMSGETSKTIRAVIGDELDDMFGISESMAEYEAENEEELTAWINDGVEKRSELKAL